MIHILKKSELSYHSLMQDVNELASTPSKFRKEKQVDSITYNKE